LIHVIVRLPYDCSDPLLPQQYDQMMEEDMIGAIKIKDGLFIGDEFAA